MEINATNKQKVIRLKFQKKAKFSKQNKKNPSFANLAKKQN